MHILPACERIWHWPEISLWHSTFIVFEQSSDNKDAAMAAVECSGPEGLLLKSKYWCNHCYFQCWRTTNLQFILLFATLFTQPVQNEPQSTSFPPSFPLTPSLLLFLRFCIPTSSVCNDLAGLRQTLYPTLFTEKEWAADVNVTLTGITHVAKWMHAYLLCHIHTYPQPCMWTHKLSHKESIGVHLN